MKKQLIFIHGGSAFSKYNDFVAYLQTKTFDPLEEKKRWRFTLQKDLGDIFEVFKPEMPNSENAKYEEWAIWFERYLDCIDEKLILVGHSLGAMFLQKYIIENEISKSIVSLILVAPPVFYFKDEKTGEDGGDFNFDIKKLPILQDKVESVTIYHSKDDFVVPYKNAVKLQEAVMGAELVTFTDRNHFLQEKFPEMIELIKEL